MTTFLTKTHFRSSSLEWIQIVVCTKKPNNKPPHERLFQKMFGMRRHHDRGFHYLQDVPRLVLSPTVGSEKGWRWGYHSRFFPPGIPTLAVGRPGGEEQQSTSNEILQTWATALLRRVFSLSRAESKFFRFQIEETDERSGGQDPVRRMRTWTRTRWRRGVETEQKMEKESKP